MSKPKLERQFPALFAKVSTMGPPDIDALIAQLHGAGMTAAAWLVENILDDREEGFVYEEKCEELEGTIAELESAGVPA